MASSLAQRHGATLLGIATASIEHGLRQGMPLPVRPGDFADELFEHGAAFVTLHERGELRGCIGTPQAYRPLAIDVAANAFGAAFEDPRFPGLAEWELPLIELSVSLLSAPEPLAFVDESELLQLLRPGVDGLIIEAQARKALFLPSVWEGLPEPAEFLAHLKAKAGLFGTRHADLRAWRFIAEEISAV